MDIKEEVKIIEEILNDAARNIQYDKTSNAADVGLALIRLAQERRIFADWAEKKKKLAGDPNDESKAEKENSEWAT